MYYIRSVGTATSHSSTSNIDGYLVNTESKGELMNRV